MSHMHYVYLLRSLKDRKLYVGYTEDLKKRILFHNEGKNTSTIHRRPLVLLYYEAYVSEKDARRRELFLKSGRGREVIKNQLMDSMLIS